MPAMPHEPGVASMIGGLSVSNFRCATRPIGWWKLGRFHTKQIGQHIYSVTCVGREQWSIGRVHQVTNEAEWLSYLFKDTPVLALNRLEAQCLAAHYSLAFAHPVIWCRWE
jgi:hypothetical protein